MFPRSVIGTLLCAASMLVLPRSAVAQAVGVTVSANPPTILVGQTSIVQVLAQVVPAQRANAERIFSWYVDVLNSNGNAAAAQYVNLAKTASDNDVRTSSTGVNDGAHRRGIYDTFLNMPGAGVATPVELLRFPVIGVSSGSTRFRVQAGTGVPQLAEDFLVAPIGLGNFLSGGDYSTAFADLQVTGQCKPNLTIARLDESLPARTYLLSFSTCSGFNHTVEAASPLVGTGSWQALPGAPHNSGSLVVTNLGVPRFFRVRLDAP